MIDSCLLALTLAVLGGAIGSLKAFWQFVPLPAGFGEELDPIDLGQKVAAVRVMAMTFFDSTSNGNLSQFHQ